MQIKYQIKFLHALVARAVCFFVLINLLFGCKTGNLSVKDRAPEGQDLPGPSGYTPPKSMLLNAAGVNTRAKFSKEYSKILFISRNRTTHPQPQVYEFNLKTQSDRRITFQDGEIFDVAYSSDENHLYYSSTTDEIKEDPDFIRVALGDLKKNTRSHLEFLNFYGEKLPPTEIYASTLDGRSIERITDSPGFDGQISTSPSRKEIAVISVRQKKRYAYILNPKSKHVTPLRKHKGEIDAVHISPSGKYLVWTNSTSEIWISDLMGAKATKVISDEFINIDPIWHPNEEEIIFASNRISSENYELFAIKKDGTCLRRLTYNSAPDRLPDISSDGKKLLFSSNRTGIWQIYLTEYSPPPCPSLPESLQSNP